MDPCPKTPVNGYEQVLVHDEGLLCSIPGLVTCLPSVSLLTPYLPQT